MTTKTELIQLSQLELADMLLAKQGEVDALAAHLMRLHNAGIQLMGVDDLQDDEDIATVHSNFNDVLIATPEASLAWRDAEVARKAIEDAVNSVGAATYDPPDDPHCCAVTHNDALSGVLQYAERVKRGEV